MIKRIESRNRLEKVKEKVSEGLQKGLGSELFVASLTEYQSPRELCPGQQR